MPTLQHEIDTLRDIAANQAGILSPAIRKLRRRARSRAEELRRSDTPRLRFGAQRKSIPRLHAEDAQRGVTPERLHIPRGGLGRGL